MAVTTVEGIGSTKTALHPVQVNTAGIGSESLASVPYSPATGMTEKPLAGIQRLL